MFVELHILQNFAPSNLNRDDTGAPKDCEFGGFRRARISSQCLKRAIRKHAGFAQILAGRGGVRTRRLIVEIAERLTSEKPAPDRVVKLVSEVFKEGGIERPERGQTGEKDNTKLILFMNEAAIDEMVERFRSRWDRLNDGDKQARSDAIDELGEILVKSAKVPDIALFGRMVEIEATKPFGKKKLGVDAACQVAHAISSNQVSMEFDFYTAVDDLLPEGETGAGMMGTVEFNSACFYRYANVDLDELVRNLDGDRELAQDTLKAFLRASVAAVPTGKQNSMSAQNPPSLVFAVLRDAGLWSLANAFVRPVRADQQGDLIQNSIRALDRYWGQLAAMYGEGSVAGRWLCTTEDSVLDSLADARLASVDQLVEKVAKVAFQPVAAGGA